MPLPKPFAGSDQLGGDGAKSEPPSRRLASQVKIVDLRVNGRNLPVVVDTATPRLSWRLESDRRGTIQTAYRIRVATSEQALHLGDADLWDSGKVESRCSLGILYGGRELTSRQCCWWNVEVWDEGDVPSERSLPACWEMGLLKKDDWVAQWLAVEDDVQRADRENGLHWIWGDGVPNQLRHRFRFNFELSDSSISGELFAAVKQSFMFSQITRVWLDGVPLAGPGHWVEWYPGILNAPHGTTITNLSSQRIKLGALERGRHVLAVEIGTRSVNAFQFAKEDTPENVPGFAAMLKFDLADGETIRLSSGAHWVANSDEGIEEWYHPAFNDASWSPVMPNLAEPHQPWPAQPAMHLRTSFEVDKAVAKARLYVTALGVYEARLNGEKVGDELLAPGPSQYDKRLFYQTLDVAALIRPGPNLLGFTVADGWYAAYDGRFAWGDPPRGLLAQLELTYDDGSRQLVHTGPGWRIAESGIRSSQLKIGEFHDNRLEPVGWEEPCFDASQWFEAHPRAHPDCALRAQPTPPIRVKKRFKPVAITKTTDGDDLIDFGECFAGWCELVVIGNPGDRIDVIYGERLTTAGKVDQAIMNQDPWGESRGDTFLLHGGGMPERLASRFVYRGFRYAQIRGLKSPPDMSSLEGIFIHTDLEETAKIRCDRGLLKGICKIALQAQKSTFVGVPVDNNVREVRAYQREVAIFGEAAAYLIDVRTFFPTYLLSLTDGQATNGPFPPYAPLPRFANVMPQPPGDTPGAGDAIIFITWRCWRHYGDTELISANWEAMCRYSHFVATHNPNYLWLNQRAMEIGDWLDLEPTPMDLFATAIWAGSTDLLAQMAEAIGRTEEAVQLRALHANIQKAFNAAYVNADGTVGNGSQCGYVLSLAYRLLDAQLSTKAAGHLAHAILSRNPQGLTTGTWSTGLVLDVLADNGHGALAHELLTSTCYPSWGYMLRHGATAVWEYWDGATGAQNQPTFGSVAAFIFRRVAGIAPAAPGFETIDLRPLVVGSQSGGGSYKSIMGHISTDWSRKANGDLSFNCEIPANTTAKVTLPVSETADIREGEQSLTGRSDVQVIERSNCEVTIEIGSGSYRFIVPLR